MRYTVQKKSKAFDKCGVRPPLYYSGVQRGDPVWSTCREDALEMVEDEADRVAKTFGAVAYAVVRVRDAGSSNT